MDRTFKRIQDKILVGKWVLTYMVKIEVKKIGKYKEAVISLDDFDITTGLMTEEESYNLALSLVETAEKLANTTYIESPTVRPKK